MRTRSRPPRRRPTTRATFDVLWGERATPSRGQRALLTRDRIVRAAIAIADRDGLDALTMASVAARLSVTPMATYRHVRDKEQLVALMIDAALGDPPPAGGPGWRPALAAWARSEHALFRAHPWLLAVITRRTAVGPHWASWLDRALEALESARLSARERIAVVLLVDGHVRAAADLEIAEATPGDSMAAFGAALEAARAGGHFRALAAAFDAGAFREVAPGESNAFEFGLERLLDGVDAYERTRAPRTGAEGVSTSRPGRRRGLPPPPGPDGGR